MRTGTADCGMRYAVRRSGSSVAYCSLTVGAGTRYETGYHSGIAHFTEHTLFKGTEFKSAAVINGFLDRLGGELNAYTTKEEIVLHATVLKEDLQKAGALLMEIASTATFPENEIDTERGVVIDEIKSYKDSPADDIYDRFEEKLFCGHPLSMPILGTAGSVRAITADELRRFRREKFVPERMAFSIVADIDEAKMESLLLKMAGKYFTAGTSRCDPPAAAAAIPANVFDQTVRKKNHEANAVIGGLAPSLYEEKERMAAILLGNILGGPASNSMLNSILREKNGWVYGVESSYTQYSDTGIMAICLGCERSNIDKCIAAVHKALTGLQTVELTGRKLAASKKQLLGQLAISSDNGEAQCLSMGKSLLAYGKVASSEENRRQIEEITSAEIMEMARRIFDPGKTSRLIML